MSDSQQVPSEIGTEDRAVNEHRDNDSKKVNTDTNIYVYYIYIHYIMTYTQLFFTLLY